MESGLFQRTEAYRERAVFSLLAARLPHPFRLLGLVGLFGLYVVAGKVGLSLAIVHASASAVWPPTGIALAAFLTLGYRVWPTIFAGAFVVNITTAGSMATSLGIAAGHTLEGLLGAYLVNRFAGGARAFDHARDVFKFTALAAGLSPIVSATIGVGNLGFGGSATWADFDRIWLTWWLGDAAAALIFTPLLVLWGSSWRSDSAQPHLIEAVGLWLSTILVGLAVFGDGLARYGHPTLPLTFLCTPPLIWAAFRFRRREAATLVALLSGVAIWETLRGSGPFASATANKSLLLLQVFMGTVSVMVLVVAALVEERRRIERERQDFLIRALAAQAEAEGANRAKDEFLAMLGCELRNPLAAMISAVSVLDRLGGHEDPAVRARAAIRHQISQLGRLVNNLLDVVHITSGEIVLAREPVNLATSVQRSVSSLASAGRLERHLVEVQAEPVWVDGDPQRLAQIVAHLLTNAIRYTPPGGTIRIRVRRDEDEALIGVEDTGTGIPPDVLARTFTECGRLDRSPSGLGVGLTLVRRLVELHRGRIEAFSEGPGRGSEFVVRLPLRASGEPFTPEDALRMGREVAHSRT